MNLRKSQNFIYHHPLTSLWLVGTLLTIPFHTVWPCIAVPQIQLWVLSYGVWESQFLWEGCHRSKDKMISSSAQWQWLENCNHFCLSLREIGHPNFLFQTVGAFVWNWKLYYVVVKKTFEPPCRLNGSTTAINPRFNGLILLRPKVYKI